MAHVNSLDDTATNQTSKGHIHEDTLAWYVLFIVLRCCFCSSQYQQSNGQPSKQLMDDDVKQAAKFGVSLNEQ